MKWFSVLGIFAMVSVLPGTAWGFFQMDQAPTHAQQSGTPVEAAQSAPGPSRAPRFDDSHWNKIRVMPALQVLGTGEAGVVNGFGSQLSLKETMSLVVPPDWTTFVRKDIDLHQLMDWSGGRDWTQILGSIGRDYGLQFQVDWRNHQIAIRKRERAFTRNGPGTDLADNADYQELGAESPLIKAADAEGKAWVIEQGESIRTALMRWAKDAGWDLFWYYDESWIAPTATAFPGTFREAIKTVVEALQAQGAPDLRPFFYSNRVVIIKRSR